MTLAAGSQLAHYTIVGPLGAGAMGEVYRAKDTRLQREVAIKVLPAHFADDRERMLRFEREATTLASLNHPNVAQIFGVDQVGDVCFLVLELVPGETLDARLARGPLPLDEALDTCRQIAEGLEAAHEAGVIHRDLKPANVRLTPDGKVKVLDFGLAKPAGGGPGGDSSDSVLSTEAGRLLGTPTYMAPEQARGRAIDRRVDVWALGCVLFECLTARRAFAGETLTDVLAAVVQREPDWTLLPAATPPRVRELLADALAKDVRERARDCGELARQLGRVLRAPAGAATGDARDGSSGGGGAAHPSAGSRPGRERLAWTLAVLALAALAWFATRPLVPVAQRPVVRASLLLPADFDTGGDRPLVLSPDGRTLVLRGVLGDEPPRLWIRRLDSTELQPLVGTEGADYPFWSPDGSELGFFADGRLKRVPATGGAVTTICASETSRGGTWGSRGEIVFAPQPFGPLFRVSAGGGTPTALTTTVDRESHRLPEFLPDGRRVLYSRTNTEDEGIWVLDLDTGASTRLVADSSDAHFAEPGLLVWVHQQDLVVRPFDPGTLAFSGEMRLLVEDVSFNANRITGPYTVSRSGDLAYEVRSGMGRLQWFDADGRPGEAIGNPARFEELALSPDGQLVAALVATEAGSGDLWLLDGRRGLGSLITEANRFRLVFPDPTTLWYGRRSQGGVRQITAVAHSLDPDVPERELDGGAAQDVSPDGQWILQTQQLVATQFDVFVRRADGSGAQTLLLGTNANETSPLFSPDGRWIGYVSDATGRRELMLRPFPNPGPSVQVTASGLGGYPIAWLADGRVVYQDPSEPHRLLGQAIDTRGPTPIVADPQPMFGGEPVVTGPFTVNADGTRLLVSVPLDENDRSRVSWVQNALVGDGEVR